MARKDESALNLLVRLPWWVSVILAGVAYVLLKYLIPTIPFENMVFQALSRAAPVVAPWVSLVLLIPAIISAINSLRRKRLLEDQKDLDSIRSLSWKEFEELVGEAYRRQGYFVLENPGEGADGGVDLRLRKDCKKVYVQCKHWRRDVGVKVVRELYGVIKAQNAAKGIIVTSGSFSADAMSFAKGKEIELVDGKQLLALVAGVQNPPRANDSQALAKTCPRCGKEMVLRTAKKGKHAGENFWGCSGFPNCRATLPYNKEKGNAL
jgi:restriction system protein